MLVIVSYNGTYNISTPRLHTRLCLNLNNRLLVNAVLISLIYGYFFPVSSISTMCTFCSLCHLTIFLCWLFVSLRGSGKRKLTSLIYPYLLCDLRQASSSIIWRQFYLLYLLTGLFWVIFQNEDFFASNNIELGKNYIYNEMSLIVWVK